MSDNSENDLVITGQEGFSINLSSPEWRRGDFYQSASRVFLGIGLLILPIAIWPGIIAILASNFHTSVLVASIGTLVIGGILYLCGDMILTRYIHKRVRVAELYVSSTVEETEPDL